MSGVWARGIWDRGEGSVDRGGVSVYKSTQLRGRGNIFSKAKGLFICSQTHSSAAWTQQPWLRDVFLSPFSAPRAGTHSGTGTSTAASSTSLSACRPCLRTLPHSPAPTGRGTCGPPSWPRTWASWCPTAPRWPTVPWCPRSPWCPRAPWCPTLPRCIQELWWPSRPSRPVPCPARWAAACQRSSRPKTTGRCPWMSTTSHLRSWWWRPRTAWWRSLVSTLFSFTHPLVFVLNCYPLTVELRRTVFSLPLWLKAWGAEGNFLSGKAPLW